MIAQAAQAMEFGATSEDIAYTCHAHPTHSRGAQGSGDGGDRQADPHLEARLDAQLACEELAEFTNVALDGEEIHYGNELAAYRRMRTALNDALASGLRARAGSGAEAQRRERNRALAAAAQLGSPMAVLDACAERFK
jgi:hypothetical protein